MDTENKNTQLPQNDIARYAFLILAAIILITVAYGLYLVRGILPYVGYFAVGAAVLFMGCGLVAGIVYIARFVTKVDSFEIGESGTVLRNALGQVTVLAPMTANQAQISRRGRKVVVTPVVPSILEDIENGIITLGLLSMQMGFEQNKGTLSRVVDKWPGTFAVAGMGRSGKTRRVTAIIIQAIFGYARVFICDPHATKDDSLTNNLRALAPWLIIATTPDEIVKVTQYFYREMENRVHPGASHSDDKTQWVIIYDEWSRLMTSDDLTEEERELLKVTVQRCSREYAGYHGSAGIIGQAWTEKEAGGTAIRRALHKTFVHNLDKEYATFLKLSGKWAAKAQDLTTRECLYRVDGVVKLITTHDVPDNTAEWVASYLEDEKYLPDYIPGPVPQLLLEAGKKQIPQNATSTKNNTGPLDESYTPSLEMTFDESDTPDEMPVPQIQMSLEERELQSLVGAWNEGYKTLDALMGATGFTQHKVRTLKSKAMHQELIEE